MPPGCREPRAGLASAQWRYSRAMVTFGVDDVIPATGLLPSQPLGEVFGDALVVGGDPTLRVLVPDGVHPLLDAVGRRSPTIGAWCCPRTRCG